MRTETFLQHGKSIRLRRQSFDCANISTLYLHSERQTSTACATVDLDGAGTAYAVLAADMRAGQANDLAQEIAQQHARLGIARNRRAVQRELHDMAAVGAQARHRIASSSVARPRRRTSSRR